MRGEMRRNGNNPANGGKSGNNKEIMERIENNMENDGKCGNNEEMVGEVDSMWT